MKYLIYIFMISGTLLCRGQVPVNEKATPEAKKLLSYIAGLGDQILSGQHCYSHETDRYFEKVNEITGKYPAIWGTDFYWSGTVDPGEKIVEEAVKKYQEGAIITLMWHVGRPQDEAPYGWKESVQNKISDVDWRELLSPGSQIHKRWLHQVDQLAVHLKALQAHHIPVLWRPYHEMNGVWFWWGNKKGDNGYAKLWQQLYARLTVHHGINNLIWVWNANAPRDIPEDEAFDYKDFYPGHEYVDILATDVYHFDYEQDEYEQLLALADGKPIALGEVGQLPKPNILKAQPQWSWFMVWSGWLETANSEEGVRDVYSYPKTLTRDLIETPKN